MSILDIILDEIIVRKTQVKPNSECGRPQNDFEEDSKDSYADEDMNSSGDGHAALDDTLCDGDLENITNPYLTNALKAVSFQIGKLIVQSWVYSKIFIN